jgi:hypothetical protein
VDDQQQNHGAVAKDGADLEMTKTAAELSLESQLPEQRLKHDQPGKGGQTVVFKMKFGNAVGFAMNRGFATLHVGGFFWLFCFVSAINITK